MGVDSGGVKPVNGWMEWAKLAETCRKTDSLGWSGQNLVKLAETYRKTDFSQINAM